MTDVSGASLPSVVFIGTVCIMFYNCTNKDYRLQITDSYLCALGLQLSEVHIY
jgi:hypothetical protein